jgi:ADP-ribose pyrophosphatase YjhB (NUDIX family)
MWRMRFCSECGTRLGSGPPYACGECGAVHYRNAKPCGGALLVHDGRVLLVKRSIDPFRDHWDIPGGFCEEREHPRAAAERELFEETGVRGRATRFHGMWIDDYGGGVVTLNVYWLLEPDGDLTPNPDSDEAHELGWFGPDELPDDIAFDHARQVLDAWRNSISA